MSEVLVIREDNHGVVGVATNIEKVFDCLILECWLTAEDEAMDCDVYKYKTMAEMFGEEWESAVREKIKTLDEFNDFFDGLFHIEKFKIY